MVIAAEPSKFTPLIALGVARVVAVEALPVSAPVNPVDVTEVKPARVVEEAPSAIAVVPIVVVLFVRAELGIFDNVFVEPEMLLFVKVSVVARPTNVSVDVGNVNVPVFTIEPITGAVSVLLVNVCVPVSVATVESIAIVTAPEPSNDVPESPVPIVRAFVVEDLIVIFAEPSNATPLILRGVASVVAVPALPLTLPVTLPVKAPVNPVDVTDVSPASVVEDPPSDMLVVPTVTELFVRDELAILESVFEDPDIVLFVRVWVSVKPTIAEDGVVCPLTAVGVRTVVPAILNTLPVARLIFSDDVSAEFVESNKNVLFVVP